MRTLSIDVNIPCRHTAFVGVDKETRHLIVGLRDKQGGNVFTRKRYFNYNGFCKVRSYLRRRCPSLENNALHQNTQRALEMMGG